MRDQDRGISCFLSLIWRYRAELWVSVSCYLTLPGGGGGGGRRVVSSEVDAGRYLGSVRPDMILFRCSVRNYRPQVNVSRGGLVPSARRVLADSTVGAENNVIDETT